MSEATQPALEKFSDRLLQPADNAVPPDAPSRSQTTDEDYKVYI